MLSPSDLCFSSAWNTLFSNVCIIHFHSQMSPSHGGHPMKNLVPPSYTYILPSTSVQFTGSVVSDSLPPRGLQHARLPCLSPTPGACSNSCLLSRWSNHLTLCNLLILLPSIFPASGSFSMSQLFASGGQNIGVSASSSVLPMNIQDWFPIGLISLQSKELSRVFSNTTVQKHQFFGTQLSS